MQKNITRNKNGKISVFVKIELSVFHYDGVSEIDLIYRNMEF